MSKQTTDGDDPAKDPAAGKVFGRFVTESIIGRGGMGVVYKAKDPVIGRTVAIKALRTDNELTASRQEELQSRFELEFQSAGTLSHPNIVTIYDVGQEDGIGFIAMEFVDGKTLDQLLREGETLTYEEICGIARDLCAGLDFAHQAGVVHRDVKPANVIRTPQGQTKIMDFGVAKVRSADLTQTGSVIGTPSYMSPEQIMGREITGACDQFAAAAIFYHMLTGKLPFAADDPATILYKVAHESPTPPSELAESLPAGVDTVLGRALSKEADQRFESCAEFAEALRRALLEGGEVALSLSDTSAPTEYFDDSAVSTLDAEDEPQSITLSHGPGVAGSTYEGAGSWWHRTSAAPRFALLGIGLIALLAAAWFGLTTFGPQELRDSMNAATAGWFSKPAATTSDPVGGDSINSAAAGGETPVVPQPAVATLEVSSTPVGAAIEVDGAKVEGSTPLSVELELGRTYQLTASRDGYRTDTVEITPSADSSRSVAFDLQKIIQPGRLSVRADYSVEVRIGGRRVRNLNSIAPGDYSVRFLAKDVFLDEQRPVQIRSNETSVVSLPSAVTVRLVSIGPNAVVSIDGQPPIDGLPIDVQVVGGTRNIKYTWPDGSTNSGQVRIDSSVSSVVGTESEITAN